MNWRKHQQRLRREELARLEARRTSLLNALAGDEAERERLDQLSTAHLIALSHTRPTLFDD